MGWTETCAVDERMRFMVAVEKGEDSFAAICRRFDVSRRVGYKWLARFEEEGVAGLLDRSRAPLHHPQASTSDLGAGEGAGLSGARRPQDGLAGGEHDRRAVRSRGADGEAEAAPAQPAIECALCPL